MNFYFPGYRALCTAENTSHTLHNILTIRAVVRDAHAWAHYLTETIELWGDRTDVVFASHHWPTWTASAASSSSPCSATCTCTSTTRRCAC